MHISYNEPMWLHSAAWAGAYPGGNDMTLGTILLIVLVLLLLGAIPTWPHSRSWGYGPSGGLGLVLLIVVVLLLLGRI
jgi:hypothetical protein